MEVTQQSTLIAVSKAESEYLDEYCGYESKLNEMLREIGAAVWARRTRSHAAGQHVELSSKDLDTDADFLQNSLLCMLAEDRSNSTFYPRVADNLSRREINEFVLCKESY